VFWNQELGNDPIVSYADNVWDLPELGQLTRRLQASGVLLRRNHRGILGLEGA
jgi:hypothetical protein